jgi:transcriptional regulator with XRE-family HTH domain
MNNKLGNLIKELRGKLSLRNAADKIGISHTYLDTIEKGFDKRSGKKVKPTPETLKLISKAYDYDYKQLMKIAGYIDEEEQQNDKSSEEIYEDEDFQVAFRSAEGFSEENKQKVLEYIEMIKELEKGRKPGDKQPRQKKR